MDYGQQRGSLDTLPLTSEMYLRVAGGSRRVWRTNLGLCYTKTLQNHRACGGKNEKNYASDCDMKQRWRKPGILGCQTDIQCYHYGSASWRLATPEASLAIHAQADRDRATYFLKWGERL
jgi:hypothetical protein